VTRVEAKRIIDDENLSNYNMFEDRNNAENEVGD
jgi:hypothetical protein